MYHLCAVADDATLACWTIDYGEYDGLDYGEGDATPGQFTAVAAGVFANCALDNLGAPTCWGNCIGDDGSSLGVCDAPGAYTQLDLGYHAGCGILPDQTAACWGFYADKVDGADVPFPQPPAGTWLQVSMAYDFACGLQTTGAVACWGTDTAGETQAPTGTFTSVSVGLRFACGVTTGGEVVCWGANGVGQTEPPDP